MGGGCQGSTVVDGEAAWPWLPPTTVRENCCPGRVTATVPSPKFNQSSAPWCGRTTRYFRAATSIGFRCARPVGRGRCRGRGSPACRGRLRRDRGGSHPVDEIRFVDNLFW